VLVVEAQPGGVDGEEVTSDGLGVKELRPADLRPFRGLSVPDIGSCLVRRRFCIRVCPERK